MKKNKAVAITAGTRKNSNSAAAARYFCSAAEEKNYSAEAVNVNNLEIAPCSACGACGKKLKCKIRDDAGFLMKKVEGADIVIVASPIYFTGVPSPLKAFIDRNQVKWRGYKKNRGKKKKKGKKGVVILTAGEEKPGYFKPAESEIKSFFAVNNIKTTAVLRFGGMDPQGEIKKKKYLNRIKKAAEKAAVG